MRLKTKFQDEDFDLGEVVEANIYHGGNGGVKVIAEPTKGGMITFYFETLKGLNEMFEDYEEPENFYIVEQRGTVGSRFRTGDEYEKMFKEIGNYFETKEEAEKAVRKLKCFTNLKNHEFMFDGWYYGTDGNIVILANTYKFNDMEEQDLTKVFGEKIC